MFGIKSKKPTDAEKLKQIQQKFPYGFETMMVKTTKESKFHEPDQTIEVGRTVGEKMIKRGWAKKVAGIILLMILSLGSYAQSFSGDFVNNTYQTLTSDTVTDAGTAVLISPVVSGGGSSVLITLRVVKISGTVAGTILIQGCATCDGNDWATVNTAGTFTSSGSPTVANATGAYALWLPASPFRRYKITHTGTGTMAARDFATIVKK